ncbi:MAG: Uma2 family endonuclease [Xenococcus sp. MO_188.B8]|nr:Uma2 family endonuclease [Xenococcus sp. MO_188.B8]
MLTVKPRFETFEEYLNYDDNSEKLYELFNGELIEMPPESGLNFEIANFLLRNTILLSISPPLLVIEVVSPGEIQRDRDYIAKRIQYQDCRIPEYWIVDPQTQKILVLELTGDSYTEVGSFSNEDLIPSPGFKELKLKVSQVFARD